jgi:hypothetical protein
MTHVEMAELVTIFWKFGIATHNDRCYDQFYDHERVL